VSIFCHGILNGCRVAGMSKSNTGIGLGDQITVAIPSFPTVSTTQAAVSLVVFLYLYITYPVYT